MAATVAGILLHGDHASRPAASAPPVGSVYSCSDHELVYVTNGSAWSTWADVSGSGSLTDHTHAATGSGSNGGGNALDLNAGTLRLPVGTGSLTTTEGYIGYQSSTETLRLYDGQRERSIGALGWEPFTYPAYFDPGAALTTTETLAANGGTMVVPMRVTGHALLEQVRVRNTDTGTQRTWGWDIYQQRLNNGNSGENTLDRVAACSANETFTPGGAASNRSITASSGPVYLAPGVYWLAIQNRHATNTFGVGTTTGGVSLGTTYKTKTTTNPNGSTLDFVAVTWTGVGGSSVGALLMHRAFGQTGPYG